MLRRTLNDNKIYIWSEKDNTNQIKKELSQYFTNDDILTFNWLRHDNGAPSARQRGANQSATSVLYNYGDALNMRNQKGAEIPPQDLLSVNWAEINRQSVMFYIYIFI